MSSMLLSYRDVEPNLSLYEDKLKFYFVASKEDEQSMQVVREKLGEHIRPGNIINVSETECMQLVGELTRKCIVVFARFEGECFNNVANTPARVLGWRCVMSTLMDDLKIPSVRSPIFNLAMQSLIICLSGIGAQEKQKYRQLVNYMGGQCVDQLLENITHLVTDNVKTKKYESAVLNSIQIMRTTWIHDVWRRSCEENVSATAQMFAAHKLPAFYNLNVTTTGLNKKDKARVQELVNAHGGKYYGEFATSLINIVIAKKNASETDKLKAALAAHKDCLQVEWIIDSAAKGCALPIDNYRIELQANAKTSTPTKRLDSSLNASSASLELSHIQYSKVNETALSNMSQVSDVSVFGRARKSHETVSLAPYKAILDAINIQDVKKAGTFLDGCCIYMCGFAGEDKDKIVKILNASGAIRYDTVNSTLSHVLIGNPVQREITMLRTLKSEHQASTVSLEWLAECIAKRTVCDAEPYIVRLNAGMPDEEVDAAPSPASKQNILSMSQIGRPAANRKRLNFDETQAKAAAHQKTVDSQLENLLIDEYANAQPPPRPAEATSRAAAAESPDADTFKVPRPAEPLDKSSESPLNKSSESQFTSEYESSMSQPATFLVGMKVFIHGFDQESTESLVNDCELAGAKVITDVNSTESVEYLILPLDAMTMDGIKVKAKHVVNHNWLINAQNVKQCTGIPYFFAPIFFPEDLRPLTNMNIVFSLYSNDERSFLVQLAVILGAEVQESFIRVNQPLLVCPEPKSAKYNAAIRWNLPVVNRNWLMGCYEQQRRVPMKAFLVGDAVAPVDDVEDEDDDDDDEVVSSQAPGAAGAENVAQNENFAGPSVTPVNRRLEQLRGIGRGKGSKPSSKTPDTTPGADPYAYLADLDTPLREEMKEMLRERDNDTPQTKRRRYHEDGIYTPEYLKTPAILEAQRQGRLEYLNRHNPTDSDKKREAEITPWTEYKRRFWKNALGDEYVSPSLYGTAANTQDISHVNDTTAASRPSGRQLQFDAPDDTIADRNLQKLNEFINNRPHDNDHIQNIILPESMATESEMPNSEQHEVIGWRDPSESAVHSTAAAVRIFSISSTTEDLKAELIEQIQRLGGKVSEDMSKFDSGCTHMLCERPCRSEKVLSCISAGKWFMGYEYIFKSAENGAFVDEELYEWGNPKAINHMKSAGLNGTEETIAKAAYRWRKKVQSTNVRTFHGLRVILRTAKNTQIATLIEAGDGEIIDVPENDPITKHLDKLSQATHVICQARYTKFTADELNALKRVDAPCINMTYLNACITNETFPDAGQYIYKQNG